MIAQRLRSARKAKGLTQEELASKLNTTKGTISNYENNHSSPPNEMLTLLANTLGVSTDWLLGRTDNSSPQTTNKSIAKTDKTDELTTIMYHKWDQLDERRRKQALKLIEILEQEADEENNK